MVATTDARLAVRALAALDGAGVEFALLHGESGLTDGGRASDVDLVVDRPVEVVVPTAVEALAEAGLHTVVAWRYDVGTVTLFAVTRAAIDGVQLDLLFDPDGRGKYGLRSRVALAAAVPGTRWLTLRPLDELIYLLSKRQVKGQGAELARVMERAREFPPGEFVARVGQVLVTPAAHSIVQLLKRKDKARRNRRSTAQRLRTARRYAARARRPVGFWVHLQGGDLTADAAAALAARFGRMLVRASAIRLPDGSIERAAWWARQVAPVRWRPGLVVSWSPGHTKVPADLILRVGASGDGAVDSLAAAIVGAMAARVRASFARGR